MCMGKKKIKKASDWEIYGTTTYFSGWIAQHWEIKTHWRVFSVHTTPYAGLGLTLDVKAQSLRGQQQIPSASADL